jgi:peroxiredoxin Q/BCP
MLQDGDKAADFELPTDKGETLKLSSLKGKTVVVYFYPKDDTSGCTAEAKDFTRLAPEFRKAGVEVIGISPDSVESHRKFRKKHEFSGVTCHEATTVESPVKSRVFTGRRRHPRRLPQGRQTA